MEGVVDDMVDQGAELIFTTSDEFEEDTLTVAEKHPDIVFINISGDDAWTGEAPANLGNIMGRMEDMKAIRTDRLSWTPDQLRNSAARCFSLPWRPLLLRKLPRAESR